MVSVMAKKREVFGSCDGEIDVSVVVKYGDAWLCCDLNYLGFISEGKADQDWRWGWVMVPGTGWRFRRFGLD